MGEVPYNHIGYPEVSPQIRLVVGKRAGYTQ